MKRDVESLKNGKAEFDCVVIGGGIQGAGIARELSLQGVRTLLVDRGDFASGTSSRSTKLIHGGLRYLEQGRLKLVKEALHERHLLLRMVPHLVKPIPFLFPLYGGDKKAPWKIRMGLNLYDVLSGKTNIQKHENWSKTRVEKEVPLIKKKSLKGGCLFWDAQMNDSRLCLEVLKSAYGLGCSVFNYMRVTGFVKSRDKITAVNLKDLRSGEAFQVRAKLFINATGIWADELRQMVDPNIGKKLRWSKGVHLVTSKKLSGSDRESNFAMIRPTTDRRVMFMIPWFEGTTLIGTTDTEYSDKPSQCFAVPEDVEYLLQEIKNLYPDQNPKRSDFLASFSGIRALLDKGGANTAKLSREYEIEELPMGLISVLGGKYSTFRSLASKVANRAMRLLSIEARYEDTSVFSLSGLPCEAEDVLRGKVELEKKAHFYGLSDEVREYLWQNYGMTVLEIFKLFDYDPSLKEGITSRGYPLQAEIVYAIKDEMALTLSDFFRRRSNLYYLEKSGLGSLETASQVYQDYLHWSDEEIERQKSDYRQEVDRNNAALDQVDFSQFQ